MRVVQQVNKEWLGGLSDWLEGQGFVRSGDREDEGFGNILVQFKREDCEVHALRERGEWFISLAPPGGTPSVGPYVWRHYLDSVNPDQFRRPDSLEEQLDFVYSRLGEIIAAIGRDREIGSRLRAVNRVIVSRRLGVDPVTLKRKEPTEGEDKQ